MNYSRKRCKVSHVGAQKRESCRPVDSLLGVPREHARELIKKWRDVSWFSQKWKLIQRAATKTSEAWRRLSNTRLYGAVREFRKFEAKSFQVSANLNVVFSFCLGCRFIIIEISILLIISHTQMVILNWIQRARENLFLML